MGPRHLPRRKDLPAEPVIHDAAVGPGRPGRRGHPGHVRSPWRQDDADRRPHAGTGAPYRLRDEHSPCRKARGQLGPPGRQKRARHAHRRTRARRVLPLRPHPARRSLHRHGHRHQRQREKPARPHRAVAEQVRPIAASTSGSRHGGPQTERHARLFDMFDLAAGKRGCPARGPRQAHGLRAHPPRQHAE